MKEIFLGFKAYDVHELLCHAIADAGGMYAEANIRAKLIDTTFLPDEALPENTFHVACGAALAGFLSGLKRKIVFVACDRPMFWLYGRSGVSRIEHLANGRVATFPEMAPPAKFLQKLLHDSGIRATLLPSRDDVSRLAQLSTGSVDGALLSSFFSPAEVEQCGCTELAFIGDHLQLPSSGLAVSDQLLEQNSQLVATVVNVYQQAMHRIFDPDQELLRDVLLTAFRMPAPGLDRTVQIIRNCYQPLGYSSDKLLQSAVDGMAAGMGLATHPIGEIYDFSYLRT